MQIRLQIWWQLRRVGKIGLRTTPTSLSEKNKRKVVKTGFWVLRGKKADAIDYYTKEIEKLSKEVKLFLNRVKLVIKIAYKVKWIQVIRESSRKHQRSHHASESPHRKSSSRDREKGRSYDSHT